MGAEPAAEGVAGLPRASAEGQGPRTRGSWRPGRWLLRATPWLVLLLGAPLGGCMSFQLLEWIDDEVAVEGFSREPPGFLPQEAVLRIKNVPGVVDGRYLLGPPVGLAELPLVTAPDGFLETEPLPALTLEPLGKESWALRAPWIVRVAPDAGAADLEGALDGAVSAFVEAREDGFRVHLLRADEQRQRWVRVGVASVGPGDQSDARVLAYAALPVTVAWDVVTWPLALVATLAYTVYEESL